MTSRARASLLLATAAVASTLLIGSAAHAESAPRPPECKLLLLPAGGAVPANLPAFVVEDRSSPGLKSGIVVNDLTGPSSSVKLGVIADSKTPEVTLLVPPTNDPLEVGVEYALGYSTTCSTGKSSFTTAKVTTGPAVALPTRIGSVKELADGTAVITPSTELAAFIQTSRFEVFVDGQSTGFTRYGAGYGTEITVRAASSYVTVGSGFAFEEGAKALCTPGAKQTHEVKLVAHVAGADGDTEPLTFSIEADCTTPANGGGNTILPDGGGDDRGASGGPDDGAAESSSSGGCTVAGGGPLGSLAAFFATGAALTVLFRRRRAR